MKKYLYIGDISREDAEVLAWYSEKAHRVLEFGVGGSTQIFCQCCPEDAKIISLDTCDEWIKFINDSLKEFGLEGRCSVLQYDKLETLREETYDLIFDDGEGKHRLDFVIKAWQMLDANGGKLIFHDTRREKDIKNACHIIQKYYNEIKRIETNQNGSNMTIITKKPLEKWVNWNDVENKMPWMKSLRIQNKPAEWMSILYKQIFGGQDAENK